MGKGPLPLEYKLFLTGAKLQSTVNQDTTFFKVSGLSIYQDFLIRGLLNLVIRGTITDSALDQLRELSRKQQADLLLEKQRKAFAAFWKAIYGSTYSRMEVAEVLEEQLRDLRLRELRHFKRQHYRADNAVLIMTGQFNSVIAEAHIRRQFEQLSLPLMIERWNQPSQKQQKSSQKAFQKTTQTRYFASSEEDRTQIEIVIAYPLNSDHSPQAHAARLVFLEMIQAELADIREVLGATYGMHAALMDEGQETEVLLITGALDRRRIPEVLQTIQVNLQGLQNAEHFARNFTLARRTVAHQLLATPSDSQALAKQLAYIARHQLPMDYFSQLTEHVASLTTKEIQTLAQTVLADGSETILCIGPKKAIEDAYKTWKVTDIQWIHS